MRLLVFMGMLQYSLTVGMSYVYNVDIYPIRISIVQLSDL